MSAVKSAAKSTLVAPLHTACHSCYTHAMIPIAKTILDANQKLYQEADNPLRSHGPDHHLRVYEHAIGLAKESHLSYDEDIMAAAALLHDVSAYQPDVVGDNYHEHDHIVAHSVLKSINFPQNKIPAVLEAIANHGSDAVYKKDNELTEVTLLRDADKLDVFGPLGVARIIMVRTLRGDTLQAIVDEFWTNGHLERKWQSLSLDSARELAQKNYKYSQDFFSQLDRSLGSNKE